MSCDKYRKQTKTTQNLPKTAKESSSFRLFLVFTTGTVNILRVFAFAFDNVQTSFEIQ